MHERHNMHHAHWVSTSTVNMALLNTLAMPYRLRICFSFACPSGLLGLQRTLDHGVHVGHRGPNYTGEQNSAILKCRSSSRWCPCSRRLPDMAAQKQTTPNAHGCCMLLVDWGKKKLRFFFVSVVVVKTFTMQSYIQLLVFFLLVFARLITCRLSHARTTFFDGGNTWFCKCVR